jgi:NAD(P) transhydrogenase
LEGERFLVPEDVGLLNETPRRLAVLGGSITAVAFARLFAKAGASVTLIDPDPEPLKHCGFQSIASRVDALHKTTDDITLRCANAETVVAEAVLCAEKRIGATASLGLAIAELEADDEGRLWCDERGFTWQPTIAAAGEVVGFPREIARDRDAARRLVASQFPQRIAGRIDAGCEPNAMRRHRMIAKPPSRTTASTLKLYEAIADG